MSLVIGDQKIVEIAERNMQGIVPLFYKLEKAVSQTIDKNSMYEGMISAYINGNIGGKSNEITKIWNNSKIDLDSIKRLTYRVNIIIDYAKTLYKPDMPKDIENQIKLAINGKLPHFFIYAKNKSKNQVKSLSNSTVDRIKTIIPENKFNFKNKTLGKFDYRMLMKNANIEQDELYNQIISKFYELSRHINILINVESKEQDNYNYLFKKIKKELFEICDDKYKIVDVLIYQLFNVKKSRFKSVFWGCFGDIIVENIKNNMKENYIYCNKCGKRFLRQHGNEYLCNECKGYKKIEEKEIICIDCGKIFKAKGNNNRKTRCDECYKIYRNEYKKINKNTNKSDR